MKKKKIKDEVIPEYEEILYVKRSGRYIPVSDPWACSGLRNGVWYVEVRPGRTTIRRPIFPDRMELTAAVERFRDGLEQGLRMKSRTKLQVYKNTKKEQEARKAYKKAIGDDNVILTLPTVHEIVDAAIEYLKERL